MIPCLYGSSVWYSPQGISQATKTVDRQLDKVQNRYLRQVTGAYKAVHGRLLEKESDTPPITTRLETLTAKATRRYKQSIGGQIVREEAAKIRARAHTIATARNNQRRPTPGQEKLRWLREKIPENHWNETEMDRTSHHDRLQPLTWKEALQKMSTESWERRWETYLQQTPEGRKAPAHRDTRKTRSQLHVALSKATSALVTQIRTEKIGLNAFLTQQRVPGYTADCSCGWRRQTAKHILLHCPNFAGGREGLFRDAGTNSYSEFLVTTR